MGASRDRPNNADHTHGDRPRPGRKLLLILALIVLLPALFYSAYEINTLSLNEQVMASLYASQLDFILFSLNQHAWDIVNAWAGSVNALFEDSPGSPQFQGGLHRFLQRNPSIDAIVVTDTLGRKPVLQGRISPELLESQIALALRDNGELIERVNRYKQLEYRRMEVVPLGDTLRRMQPFCSSFPWRVSALAPDSGGW